MAKRRPANPVDDALTAREKLASDRRARRDESDVALHAAWKADPSPTTTRALTKRFAPVFRSKLNLWKAPATNRVAMLADLESQMLRGAETWDPQHASKASFSTHVENQLRRAQRFNVKQQNKAMIAEEPASHIGRINAATDELREQYGRAPTSEEIAAHVNPQLSKRRQLNAAKIQQITTQQRKDIPASQFESSPVQQTAHREEEVVGLLPTTFQKMKKPDHVTVLKHLYGLEGTARDESTGSIAKKLGWNPSKVARIRTDIGREYKKHRKQG